MAANEGSTWLRSVTTVRPDTKRSCHRWATDNIWFPIMKTGQNLGITALHVGVQTMDRWVTLFEPYYFSLMEIWSPNWLPKWQQNDCFPLLRGLLAALGGSKKTSKETASCFPCMHVCVHCFLSWYVLVINMWAIQWVSIKDASIDPMVFTAVKISWNRTLVRKQEALKLFMMMTNN